MRSKVTQMYYINMAAQPHDDGTYLKLLKWVALQRMNLWGDDYAAITEPREVFEDIYQGRIVVWTEIDTNQPGIDLDALEEVNLEDKEFSIPENLGINGRLFTYTFFV